MADAQTPPTGPQDWDSYLAMLDLSNPTLAAYLRDALSGLVGAVPNAGQYTTGVDYQTLHAALASEYVKDVIQQYQAILGPSPELYDAAVANGWMSKETADALQAQGFTQVGTLQRKYAAQGGLHTLAGPYMAERTQLLGKAMQDMEQASQKASSDAYQLAQQTTQTRVTALSNAGQIGLGLTQTGVSRRNAQTAAEAAGAGEGEQPGFQLPNPAPAPAQPSLWEKLLLAGIPAAIAGAGKWLGEPGQKTAEQRAIDQVNAEHAAAQRRLELNAPERPPGLAGDAYTPAGIMAAPFGRADTSALSMGFSPITSGGVGGVMDNPFTFTPQQSAAGWSVAAPTTFAYQTNPFSPPTYEAPSGYSYSPDSSAYHYGTSADYSAAPAPDYSGYGGYDYSGYTYEPPPDYSYDQASSDYHYGGGDYSYTPEPDYSGGYWV